MIFLELFWGFFTVSFFAFGGASSHDISDGILDVEDPDWNQKASAPRQRMQS